MSGFKRRCVGGRNQWWWDRRKSVWTTDGPKKRAATRLAPRRTGPPRACSMRLSISRMASANMCRPFQDRPISLKRSPLSSATGRSDMSVICSGIGRRGRARRLGGLGGVCGPRRRWGPAKTGTEGGIPWAVGFSRPASGRSGVFTTSGLSQRPKRRKTPHNRRKTTPGVVNGRKCAISGATQGAKRSSRAGPVGGHPIAPLSAGFAF